MDFSSVTQTFAQISIDWIIFAAIALVAAADALRSGVSRPLALSLAAGIAYFLYSAAGTAAFISVYVGGEGMVQAAIAGALVVIMFILLYRMTDPFGINTSGAIGSVIAGLATAVALIVIWQALPFHEVRDFGPQFQRLFGEEYAFWWLLLSYGAFTFVRR